MFSKGFFHKIFGTFYKTHQNLKTLSEILYKIRRDSKGSSLGKEAIL
jgi:hypothetical protein